ncbi:hypothetical protein GG344DRAFT_86141 [Lentinula edodes]|nr:hypothetical protein GG344DRAFT_86141 [Lentinula edodes]
MIQELGGQVDGNVPDRGYVLADLHNPESQRAFQLFSAERWVVPLTFVEACKTAGAHIAPIFLESEGRPMPIHVHESIANVKFREALYEKILYCAGFPYASLESARVIIADSKTDVFNALVKHYQLTPHKYIESLEWVDRCIERQGVSFTPHVFKNPGGRRAGEERTQFTEEDEQKLCEWIAAKIPFKSTGGRTGNKLYQQLCEMSNHPEYSWVTRHTWQSWRERYKKNAGRLDKIVDKIVSTTKPNQGEKWQYGYVRQDDDKPKKKRKRLSKHEDGQEFVVGSSSAGQESVHADPHHLLAIEKTNGESEMVMTRLPLGQNREAQMNSRRDPMEPPTITDDTLQLAITVAVAGHVLEQELSEIALQTRFTVEEVREYYDKYGGDLERTSRRLQKMREHLNALLDDD